MKSSLVPRCSVCLRDRWGWRQDSFWQNALFTGWIISTFLQTKLHKEIVRGRRDGKWSWTYNTASGTERQPFEPWFSSMTCQSSFLQTQIGSNKILRKGIIWASSLTTEPRAQRKQTCSEALSSVNMYYASMVHFWQQWGVLNKTKKCMARVIHPAWFSGKVPWMQKLGPPPLKTQSKGLFSFKPLEQVKIYLCMPCLQPENLPIRFQP